MREGFEDVKPFAEANGLTKAIDPGMLGMIVDMQKTILERFYKVDELTLDQRDARTHEFLTAIVAEVGEIYNGENLPDKKGAYAIKWKSWKTQSDNGDPEYVKTELIDILHFTIELLILWGCDSKEIFARYMNKARENHTRYDNKY
jgi:dUTPase-like protein